MDPSVFNNEEKWSERWSEYINSVTRRCSRCVYDNHTPSIFFDDNGVCNYCKSHDELTEAYPGGKKGEAVLSQIFEKIKKERTNSDVDVVVGVSGGVDSSYLLKIAIDNGLKPLAVHFDNTWNSTIAVENIRNVLEKLNVELWTYVVNNNEYDDLYHSFLKAGVPDLEAPTDIGLARVLNMAAEKFGTKYIFEGHSFRTEGISPLGWLYMDGKYIRSLNKKFGTAGMKTFPNLTMTNMLKSMIYHRIKKIRPFWYMDYEKQPVMDMLTKDYGWKWYGGHHLENRMTNFYHTYFLPRRFGIDQRPNGFSALARTGQLDRLEAIKELETPPRCDPQIREMVLKRLKLTEAGFTELMELPEKTYKDYPTYKKTFELLRPFFYIMAKSNLIPWSFYLKYTAR